MLFEKTMKEKDEKFIKNFDKILFNILVCIIV